MYADLGKKKVIFPKRLGKLMSTMSVSRMANHFGVVLSKFNGVLRGYVPGSGCPDSENWRDKESWPVVSPVLRVGMVRVCLQLPAPPLLAECTTRHCAASWALCLGLVPSWRSSFHCAPSCQETLENQSIACGKVDVKGVTPVGIWVASFWVSVLVTNCHARRNKKDRVPIIPCKP